MEVKAYFYKQTPFFKMNIKDFVAQKCHIKLYFITKAVKVGKEARVRQNGQEQEIKQARATTHKKKKNLIKR